ncbi:CAP domain-containing protein [Paenibacillus sp. JX-17]|uniref:CAP domain-containing protein n=1 Tax=Paenibacillus lacisoli TaxID=3064525 RepID=A0ABT9CBK1_9BACL|nr:CAP domain-containing protein [Paenibacillus sp. JX-17]MDO7904993.1 CAP domain-containing protein [Paenibacillus sp. JX-17]
MTMKWTKTLIAGSIAAVLSVGLILPASAATPTQDQNLNNYIQQWLKNNNIQWSFNTAPTQIQTAKPAQQAPTQEKPAQKAPAKSTTGTAGKQKPASTDASYAAQVIELVNKERTKAGLKPLTNHAKLSEMALVKAKDMSNNNYFDHQSPTYGSPFDMMKKFGISYSTAGENIAKGQRTPQEVVDAWMNSEGHRANILNGSFTQIGVGYYNGCWVQEFIG